MRGHGFNQLTIKSFEMLTGKQSYTPVADLEGAQLHVCVDYLDYEVFFLFHFITECLKIRLS